MFDAETIGAISARRVWLGLVAGVALSVAAWSASSTTVTRRYDFEADDFVPVVGTAAAPTHPVVGAFIVTFDPTVAVFDQTVGIKLISLNLTLSSPLAFDFVPFGQLTIGGLASTAAGVDNGVDDFYLAIQQPLTDAPHFAGLIYSSTSPAGTWAANAGSVTVSDVPEPASWALMIGGFGLVGATLRRRRTAVAKA
jgi:hypothetical protein